MPLVSRAAERLNDVPGYHPGAAPDGALSRKLSSNESPLGVSPVVRSALVGSLAAVGRYPQDTAVRARLADSVGLRPEHVVLTNGSDELCALVATAFLAPGDVVVQSEPAYAIDTKVSMVSGATLVSVPLRDGRHDLEGLARHSHGACVLWLPTPHNPTGTAVAPGDLATFLSLADRGCLIVLDEAYRAYLDETARPDVRPLLDRHPNLLVQRTFSKDHSLAGLRLGYGLADPRIIDLLVRVRAPFSVNTMALSAAGAALDDGAWNAMSVSQVVTERRTLESELESLGIEFFPSQANFVTARVPHATLADSLAAHHLTVRPGEDLGLPGWVRISIGTPQAMAVLRRVLRDTLGDHRHTDPQPPRTSRST
jgi:histidinol-phosphate aminotransferase